VFNQQAGEQFDSFIALIVNDQPNIKEIGIILRTYHYHTLDLEEIANY
jgi:hypothetical protein